MPVNLGMHVCLCCCMAAEHPPPHDIMVAGLEQQGTTKAHWGQEELRGTRNLGTMTGAMKQEEEEGAAARGAAWTASGG